MKYKQEYDDSRHDKKTFIKVMTRRYPNLKHTTILRRWHDCKSGIKRTVDSKKPSKYLDEYNMATSKKDFVKIMSDKHPHLKHTSILRGWYKIKKRVALRRKVEVVYDSSEKMSVNVLKLLLFKDMKRYKMKITRKYLRIYGFTNYEINWLIDEGEKIEE